MSTTPVPQNFSPKISAEVPWEVSRHLQILYGRVANIVQGISLQSGQISSLKSGTSSTTTVVEGGGGGGGGGGGTTTASITVNDQSGNTSYSTVQGDNLALIVFSDGSPVGVTLTTQTPPWACFAANLGAGTVTFTPASGNINGGATFDLNASNWTLIVFDGAKWFAAESPVGAQSISKVTHEWLDSYDASTGLFTQSQPTAADVTNAFDLTAATTDYPGTLTLDALVFSTEDQGVTFPNGSQFFEDATLGTVLFGTPKCTIASDGGAQLTLESGDGVNSGSVAQISGITSPVTPIILEILGGVCTSYLINTKDSLLDPSNTYEFQLGVGANSGSSPPTFAPSVAVGDSTFILKGPAKALSTVTVAAADLITGGPSATLTLAALTTLGTQGSITFVNGVITAFTPST